MAAGCEYFTLNDGNKMPAIGLGTSQGNPSHEVKNYILYL